MNIRHDLLVQKLKLYEKITPAQTLRYFRNKCHYYQTNSWSNLLDLFYCQAGQNKRNWMLGI